MTSLTLDAEALYREVLRGMQQLLATYDRFLADKPIIALRPTRQNWCTVTAAEMKARSCTTTSPAIPAVLAITTWLPTRQSCAIWL